MLIKSDLPSTIKLEFRINHHFFVSYFVSWYLILWLRIISLYIGPTLLELWFFEKGSYLRQKKISVNAIFNQTLSKRVITRKLHSQNIFQYTKIYRPASQLQKSSKMTIICPDYQSNELLILWDYSIII